MGVHRETLYRRLRTLRTDAEAAYRGQHGAGGLQLPLQKQVRLVGLPGTSTFEGKVASRWAPQQLESFSTPRPDSFEQVLAVVAVWESWTGVRTLEADGRIRQAWLSGEMRRDWQRLLESAYQETIDARRRSPEPSGAEAEADAAVARYCERLVQTCGRLNLDVLGPDERAGEQPAIRLRQVFEAPPASWDPPRPELPARMWRELVERGEVPAEELPHGLRAEQVEAWRKTRTERPPLPVLEAVASAQGQRLVLLGDPGAGKSTLARYLALALAGGLETVPNALQKLVEAGTVPVVIELRHLADSERWHGRTVEDFWEKFNATERMCLPRTVFEYLLEHTHRPVLVVFDGLDEIFDPARRAEVARQVVAFAQAHTHVRVILTSRVIGFTPGVFTNADFSQAKLEDLPAQQIESFIRRWYSAAHPEEPAEAARLAERLNSAVRGFPSVAELAGNPLLLTILASIGLGATIPRDRREVYRRAVDVLTGRWDRDAKHLPLPRQDHSDVAAAIDELDAGLLQELLERLARRLQAGAGKAQTGTLISRTDLRAMISDYVTDMNYPPHVARIVAHAMVDRLHERAFLLHPYGAGMYGFVHRTFLEYLAARDLSQRYTAREWDPEQLIDMLAERATDPAWHEVILLFVGQISRQAEAEHAAFIARLLAMHRRRPVDRGELLELAIRVLAEAHRIGRTPSKPGDHPERSLAIQSNAVIDTLAVQLTRYPWLSFKAALPALESFPWSWTGRERFLRWYHANSDSAFLETKDVLAASMCRTPQEVGLLARSPWATWTASNVLRVLGERWPDRDDAYTTVLTTAHDTNANADVRATALQVLGEQWPDRDDTYTTVLTTAHDTHTDTFVRAAALHVLGDWWPDRDDAYTAVLTAAHDTDTAVRASALRVLGEQWPDRDDAYTTVLTAAHDTNANTAVRATALQVLGARWPDRDDSYAAVLTAARNTTAVRASALRVLEEQRPDRDDTYTTVLTTAHDTHTVVPATALQVLGEQWPDRDDTYTTVLTAAHDTNANADVRATALQVLGEQWPDRDDAYTTVLTTAHDTHTNANTAVRASALRVLGARWPDRDDAYTTVLTAAHDTDTAIDVRAAALQVLGARWPDRDDAYTTVLTAARNTTAVRASALRVLGERWPDRDDSYTTVLTTAHDTHTAIDVRAAALQVLGARWPDRDDAYTTVLTAARNTTAAVRATALQVLGEQWPDRDDAYTTVLTAAHDTHTNADVRATALQVLGEQWPDRDDAYTTVLTAARNTNTAVRATALQVLGEQWPDRDDSYAAVLTAAHDTHTDVKLDALRVLAQRWPNREGAWDCVARAAEESDSDRRDLAVRLLTLIWPERPSTADLLRKIAAEDASGELRIAEALAYIQAASDLGAV
ncbi:HEAT repeat domain-containing protein [Streptomyces umbrinus]|uniref:HEAT repeat domain-containing protein n=1 Tax=Streptomyces umbrinus TaxID=67370 RepID=UPI0033E8113C